MQKKQKKSSRSGSRNRRMGMKKKLVGTVFAATLALSGSVIGANAAAPNAQAATLPIPDLRPDTTVSQSVDAPKAQQSILSKGLSMAKETADNARDALRNTFHTTAAGSTTSTTPDNVSNVTGAVFGTPDPQVVKDSVQTQIGTINGAVIGAVNGTLEGAKNGAAVGSAIGAATGFRNGALIGA
ncbi:MAG TPA: hypothetical protein DEP61_03470, partial [Lachnospiraceae bacterium]|nr:hypothetical protein [Lachnospiraceae bacterium]